jgi:hypothetical protein
VPSTHEAHKAPFNSQGDSDTHVWHEGLVSGSDGGMCPVHTKHIELCLILRRIVLRRFPVCPICVLLFQMVKVHVQ